MIQNGDACQVFVRGTLTFAWDVCRRRDRNWRAHNLTVVKCRSRRRLEWRYATSSSRSGCGVWGCRSALTSEPLGYMSVTVAPMAILK